MLAHRTLYEARPAPRYLTEFYLWMSLGGALGGMFKKKQEQPQAATPPPTMAGGLMPLMTMSTELVSISRDAVSPQSFEVPADYKKTKD
jgi:hypothetical protein